MTGSIATLPTFPPMRQLESLDAWRIALDMAHSAYQLTLDRPLRTHFKLADQIRAAAVSVPANIAEGYALGSTVQFIRCLRIALGSAAEIRSHLELTRRLRLAPDKETAAAIAQAMRVISVLVGLLRALQRRSGSRFPFPVSRFPSRGSGDRHAPQ